MLVLNFRWSHTFKGPVDNFKHKASWVAVTWDVAFKFTNEMKDDGGQKTQTYYKRCFYNFENYMSGSAIAFFLCDSGDQNYVLR